MAAKKTPEQYIRETRLHTTINDALGEVITRMPDDPIGMLINYLSQIPKPNGEKRMSPTSAPSSAIPSSPIGDDGMESLVTQLEAVVKAAKQRSAGGFDFAEREKELILDLAMMMDADLRRGPSMNAQLRRLDSSASGVQTDVGTIVGSSPLLYGRLVKSKRAAQLLLQVALSMTNSTTDNTDTLIDEIMTGGATLVDADRCTFFLVDEDELVSKMAKGASEIRIPIGTGLAGHVARTGEIINIPNAWEDPRFNRSIDLETGYRTTSILCMPVKFEGCIVAVAQLLNKQGGGPFNLDDEEMFEAFATFAGVCIRSHQLYQQALYEKRRTEIFVKILRKLSHTDIRDMNKIATQIIRSTTELLNADRCTLYLVDKERDQLVSKVATKAGPTEIRVNIGEGVAGYVARHGMKLNIKDAYADTRFSPETDRRMGYTTRTILSMPIMDSQHEIVAVTQVINKLQGTFNEEDEELLEYFSLFAGIALSNARLYEFVLESGNKAMDLFNMASEGHSSKQRDHANFFGLVPTSKELHSYMELTLTDKERADVLTVDFNPHDYSLATDNHRRLVPLLAYIFSASGLTETFKIPLDIMFRFLICCKKKYRMVPYHSITHAFDVTQTLYLYLWSCGLKDLLTEFDCFILMVCGVLHDIDHMGLNNSFHFKAETPLGVLSAASGAQSVLEVHHCNLSIELLGMSECDVFCGLTKDQKKEAFKSLIYNILATDMAKHKEMIDKFKEMVAEGYDRSNADHRRVVTAMLLKCADISNVTKPFDISRLWGIAATEEFFAQGEAEKLNKVELTPQFQKEKGMELATSQLGFINFVVAPMMVALCEKLFVGLTPFQKTLMRNVEMWEALLKKHREASA
eukprot:GGOE01004472.1.p1 GENE.GGOE01004472.1~~GGOE01004472.1.p1  ORF type:complete len:884 (-),score=297.49 GGOE01004472.1:509-3091(-)